MKKTRREFLLSAGKAGAFLPLSWLAAPYLGKYPGAGANRDRILVVIQLAGGNDGLNTVIPYRDEEYYKNRPVLAPARNSIHKLNDDVGLHPAMGPLKELFDQGRVAVIQGVGYPNPNRSHFRSTDIWETGIADREETHSGWIGRALDHSSLEEGAVPAVAARQADLPLALVGRKPGAISLLSLESFRLQLTGPGPAQKKQAMLRLAHEAEGRLLTELDFLRSASRVAYRCSERLESLERVGDYGSDIARALVLVARLITAGIGTRVFHIKLGGFDTHADQARIHRILLGNLASALRSFYAELEKSGNQDRVLTMTYSEFGRRLKENKSRGTDHGAAAPLFLVSGGLRGGVVGPKPDLEDLKDGDIRFHTDFRSVYSTVMEDWMGWNAKAILGKPYPRMKNLIG